MKMIRLHEIQNVFQRGSLTLKRKHAMHSITAVKTKRFMAHADSSTLQKIENMKYNRLKV